MPICMPNHFIKARIIPEVELKVSGFGDTGGYYTSDFFYSKLSLENRPDSNFKPSPELNSVTVNYVSSMTCQSWYNNDFVVEDGMMCAGHENGVRDSCVGDSGGPLVKNFVVDGDDAYYQVGIVSFGFECGKPNEPGIYTRLTEYTDWIHRLVVLRR